MFIRIQVLVRRNEYRTSGDYQALVNVERVYSDDLVGEMHASDDGHKAVDEAIDKLVAEEGKRTNTD